MKSNETAIASDLIRRQLLLKKIPKEYFAPYPLDALRIITWAGIFLVSQLTLLLSPRYPIIASLIAGSSIGLLVFLAHDLTHGTIVKGRSKYILEWMSWGLNAFPPTLWSCLHNKCHHKYANTVKDTDRIFTLEERNSFSKKIYAMIFLPLSGSGVPRNPLMLLAFFAYTFKYSLSAILNRRLGICTGLPSFTSRERVSIVLELVFSSALYFVLVLMSVSVGNTWLYAVAFHVAVPLMMSSAIAMAFIFTQHIADPLSDRPDILMTTTSLKVPRIIGILTSNTAYHVEHHLFPGMNPRYYSKVSEAVRNAWPHEYKSCTFLEAWCRIVKSPVFRPVDKSSFSRSLSMLEEKA